MIQIRNLLTPETLSLLQTIAREGSLAGAARHLGLVPSAVTYRVRQLEEGLDVLLFDRSARKATLTAAGQELLTEGEHILAQLDAVAQRVRRVATGWEPKLVIAVDGLIMQRTLLQLCEDFYTLNGPTQLKLQRETLSGTWEALTDGHADLAIGAVVEQATAGIHSKPLGEAPFVFAVAPHHPLANVAEPLGEDQLAQHRAVAVADSTRRGRGISFGLLTGQAVLTVPDMQTKLDAQLRGLGSGFVPLCMAQRYIAAGQLVVKQTERAARIVKLSYGWRAPHAPHASQRSTPNKLAKTAGQGSGPTRSAMPGRALQWWLDKLASKTTRDALLHG